MSSRQYIRISLFAYQILTTIVSIYAIYYAYNYMEESETTDKSVAQTEHTTEHYYSAPIHVGHGKSKSSRTVGYSSHSSGKTYGKRLSKY